MCRIVIRQRMKMHENKINGFVLCACCTRICWWNRNAYFIQPVMVCSTQWLSKNKTVFEFSVGLLCVHGCETAAVCVICGAARRSMHPTRNATYTIHEQHAHSHSYLFRELLYTISNLPVQFDSVLAELMNAVWLQRSERFVFLFSKKKM